MVTLVVRDNAGAESRDTSTITITPCEEVVFHPAYMATGNSAWTYGEDSTAADRAMMQHRTRTLQNSRRRSRTRPTTSTSASRPTRRRCSSDPAESAGQQPVRATPCSSADDAVDASGAPATRSARHRVWR